MSCHLLALLARKIQNTPHFSAFFLSCSFSFSGPPRPIPLNWIPFFLIFLLFYPKIIPQPWSFHTKDLILSPLQVVYDLSNLIRSYFFRPAYRFQLSCIQDGSIQMSWLFLPYFSSYTPESDTELRFSWLPIVWYQLVYTLFRCNKVGFISRTFHRALVKLVVSDRAREILSFRPNLRETIFLYKSGKFVANFDDRLWWINIDLVCVLLWQKRFFSQVWIEIDFAFCDKQFFSSLNLK